MNVIFNDLYAGRSDVKCEIRIRINEGLEFLDELMWVWWWKADSGTKIVAASGSILF